jgi:DNA polymerase III gamma/tau subunit
MTQDIKKRLEYVAAREKLELTEDAAFLLSRLADGFDEDGLSLSTSALFRER